MFGKGKSGMRERLESKLRSGLNQVVDKISEFEARGGLRDALERSRALTERTAERLRRALERRGVSFDVRGYSEHEANLRRAYRLLEVEYGAPLEDVKHAYRMKMKEHHPDRHSGDLESEKRATRIAQELSIAYDTIESHFQGRR
ncbi:MAG: J domain-containing protein [Myxococcota bacterium]|jgi:DnaJ-domain-containing protein 1|nr:J domain-containing protein [Myxococcota bacterium]